MNDVHDILDGEEGVDLGAWLRPAAQRWRSVLAVTTVAAAAGVGVSFLLPNEYTARCLFLPPQQQAGGSLGALQSMGALSSLVGANVKTTSDQYISLMTSATVSDRIIKRFELRKVFDVRYAQDARAKLMKNLAIAPGKKDNLISVEYTDRDGERAAAIANQYVVELRSLTNTLAVSEAQQRRVFFDGLLNETKQKLAAAQRSLEGAGINAAALNTEPRNAAEGYAQLKAQLTAAEVKLQVLRTTLADATPQVRQLTETVSALRGQLQRIETHDRPSGAGGDYVDRYREFKYQETLFDLFARQYEAARVDESREGALIQVVDIATPPERRSGPSRLLCAALGAAVGLVLSVTVAIRRSRRSASA